MQAPERRRRARVAALLAVCVALGPGCIFGSPLAAISGEPYGMTVDDVQAMRGRNGRIWSDAPVLAFFDLPVAFCLDTAFLPVSLIMWGIISISGGGDESDHGDRPRNRDVRPNDGVESVDAEERWESRATD